MTWSNHAGNRVTLLTLPGIPRCIFPKYRIDRPMRSQMGCLFLLLPIRFTVLQMYPLS